MFGLMTGIKEFFATGYNLYFVIGGAIVLLALIVVAVIVTHKVKRKRARQRVKERVAAAEALGDMTTDGIDVDKLLVADDSLTNTKVSGDFILKPPMRYVSADTDSIVMTAVPVKPRPKRKPKAKSEEVTERVSSFKEHIYSEEAGKRPGIIQIYIDAGGKYRFRFIASNHETVGHSQGYKAKAACRKGIEAVLGALKTAEIIDTTKDEEYITTDGHSTFEIYRDNEEKFRFRLIAPNAQNILASQGYTSKVNCINSTQSVMNIANFHNIIDDTRKKSNK